MWIKLKFSFNSDKLDHINNHTMGVITDNESYEKIIIFGGIQNQIKTSSHSQSETGRSRKSRDTPSQLAAPSEQSIQADANAVLSFLSNKCYLVSIMQRAGKSFFKDGDVNPSGDKFAKLTMKR